MARPLKPKTMGDVSVPRRDGSSWNAFSAIPSRLNLATQDTVRIPLTAILRSTIIIASVGFLIFGSANAPTQFFTRAAGDATTSTDPSTEQAQLQAQLAQLESQINQYQGQIASYESQGKSLSGQISVLNDKIASLNLQIRATNLTIEQLNGQIQDTQSQIAVTQQDITNKQTAINTLMNSLYKADQTTLLEIFLKNPRISDFWANAENISLLQSNLRAAVAQVTDLQTQLQGQQQQYEASKADAASAQQYAQAQATEVASTKDVKSQLLQQTKGQESKYQALLAQTQATAAQIRSRIFQLLGGGQLTFGQAYQFAQVASNATGIEPSFILAILDRESALGQNVGRCGYKTAMAPSQQPIFLQITSELHLNPDTMMVSCPNADGVYGGAMGPAQFEPSTWELYTDNITKITGNNPASPWNDSDAFVATALYLKDAMVGCQSVYSATISQERCTAAKYYAGSRWRSYLWTYGEAVVEQAQSFASDIQTLQQAGSAS